MEEGGSEDVGTGRIEGCMERRGDLRRVLWWLDLSFSRFFLWAGMGMNIWYARLKLHEFYFIRE